MGKRRICILACIWIAFFVSACAGDNIKNDNASGEKIEVQEAKVSRGQTLGADMAEIYYGSEEEIVFHGSFGLFVYSLEEEKIIRSVDVGEIGCSYTQGDFACCVEVNSEGTEVRMHSISEDYMYVYDVENNILNKREYEPMEEKIQMIKTPDSVKKNDGSTSHSFLSIQYENGDLGYLVCDGRELKNLKFIKGDKSYTIFENLEG